MYNTMKDGSGNEATIFTKTVEFKNNLPEIILNGDSRLIIN